MKNIDNEKKEIFVLCAVAICVFICSLLRISQMITIWNQNDEFGVWQGAAWALGLDWSEMATSNGFYGQGYGVILAPLLKIFGNNPIILTRVAIIFQAFMHTSTIFIAWRSLKTLFPEAKEHERIIAATTCILVVPDIYYIYYFFSESILRFLLWSIWGLYVSYYANKKLIKLILSFAISCYAFSVHQRCILLIAITIFIISVEVFREMKHRGLWRGILCGGIFLTIFAILYMLMYKIPQNMYIDEFYKQTSSLSGNLLSERGYTIESVIKTYINPKVIRSMIDLLSGFLFYICSFDFGLTILGVFACVRYAYNHKNKDIDKSICFLVTGLLFVLGILIVVLQNAQFFNYVRVDMLMYGRYFTYLLPPVLMLGIMFFLRETTKVIKSKLLIIIVVYWLVGYVTYYTIKTNNMSELFAFHNSCVGILSKYYTEGPIFATLYHIKIGFISMLVTLFGASWIKKNKEKNSVIFFAIISVIWIITAYDEIDFTNEMKKKIVVETNELTEFLSEESFIAFKSNSYGDGLLQYNKPFTKIYIRKELEEFSEEDLGMLVVSYKYIPEIPFIRENFEVEYENDMYLLWRYK